LDIKLKSNDYGLADSENRNKVSAEDDAGTKGTEKDSEGIKGTEKDSEGIKGTEKDSAGIKGMGNIGWGSRRKKRDARASIKYSLLAAALVTALFSLIFLSHYPNFQKNAQIFNGNGLQDDNFLVRMNVGNYILYKDIVEKTEQKSYSYYDLYMDLEVSETAAEPSGYNRQEYDDFMSGDVDSSVRDIQEAVDLKFREDWAPVMSEVGRLMDYCVVDRKSGEFIKNTEREIEALAGLTEGAEPEKTAQAGGNARRQQVQDGYAYYVAVSYDSVGNPERVAVKDENSDELLKKMQNEAKSRPLETWLGKNFNGFYGTEGSFSGYSPKDGSVKNVHYRLKSPHDVTFIYAMTEEQRQTVERDGLFGMQWSEWYVYYQSGAQEVFVGLLLLMAIVVLCLMRCRWYGLYRENGVKILLEVAVLAVIVWLAAVPEWLLGLVRSSCTGELNGTFAAYLKFLPERLYPAMTGFVNFAVLFLLFGMWFYILNYFGEVLILGPKSFLKERSLAVNIWIRIWQAGKRQYDRFKEEMLHVDLGKDAMRSVRKAVVINFLLAAVMCMMWLSGWIALAAYSVALYFILKKYISRIQMQYGKMLEVTNSIAEGNLNTVFDEDLGIFESYKEELYRIQEGFRKAVDEEVKSQRMKTELITNVSHDLKTPLTAITTYIDLLKEENITEAQRKEYLGVLEKKSLRLKTLIEDLFEVSKANSRNVTVNLVEVDICNLLRQVYLEYEDRAEESGLIFRFRMPEEKILLKLDSQKTYRIFENLYINIIKYAMTGTRVYISLEPEEKEVRIELKNMSASELQVEPDELTERFVRGDSARNTEGSGLGLAIAKSFVQVQGGRMEVSVDGDLFKVVLWFKSE